MEYSYWLYQIGNYTWLGYLIALAIVFAIKAGDKSYYFGATVLVIANLIMQILEPALVELSQYEKGLVRTIWYPTWAFCDLAAIYVIYKLHRRSQCTVKFVSKSLLISLAVLCVWQAVRYFDQFVLMTNSLAGAYKISVVSINIGCLFIAILPVVTKLIEKKRSLSVL
jgi:hypothetical protein